MVAEKGRKAMLDENGREIAKLQAALAAAHEARVRLVRTYEREKYQDEIYELRNLVANYEAGILPGCAAEIMQMM